MSEDEKTQEIGSTIHGHAEAKKNLACIESKADRMLRDINQVLRILRGETSGALYDNGAFGVRKSRGGIVEESAQWPTADEIIAIMRDRQDTLGKIATLETRMQELGLGSYINR